MTDAIKLLREANERFANLKTMMDDWVAAYARQARVIEAMHRRPWWRRGIFHRRPWRSGMTIREIGLRQWLAAAHDCRDPMIGCSCAGGFRFP